MAGAKVWSDTVLTTTGGAFSANIASAGCTTVPRVHADAISANTNVNQSAMTAITARSTTAISGFVNLPATIIVGGLGVARAGAGLTVSVLAICN